VKHTVLRLLFFAAIGAEVLQIAYLVQLLLEEEHEHAAEISGPDELVVAFTPDQELVGHSWVVEPDVDLEAPGAVDS
jgi:hypothetical protein